MKLKTALLSGTACLAGTLLFAADSTNVGVSPAPKAVQAIGTTDVYYAPTRWPIFTNYAVDNVACAQSLVTNFSGRYKSETNPGSYPPADWQPVLEKTISFKQLGLANYRKTAKVMVTWTLRAEASAILINPWTNVPRLCSPWHGTIDMNFGSDGKTYASSDIDTALFVNGVQRGRIFSMTFPPLGPGSTTNISDPTITGSVMLTSDLFNGEFPDAITCQVRWVNRTVGAQVRTPAYMRNETLFIMPVSGT